MKILDKEFEEKLGNSDKEFDLIGIGGLNWDRLLFVDRLANKGEEIGIKRIWEGVGGSAANTTTWLSKFNRKIGYVSCRGNDKEGNLIVKKFKSLNIDNSNIRVKDERTGSAFGIIDKKGERTLYSYGGASSKLNFQDIALDYINDSKIIHLTSLLGEKSVETMKKISSRSEPILSLSPGLLCQELEEKSLLSLIENSDILFLNELELEELLKNISNIRELFEKGVKIIVVTLGSEGCQIYCKGTSIEIPALDVDVKDTTGAGDAFAAGFLEGMLSNKKITECGKLGNKTAAECIQAIGGSYGQRP
ncbi:MAG: Sugar kinase ribokinase family [Candidatus Methanohalarchaeum thermophilum]|uniref:Sugar kinase ribokinase family n=1 Tax=Methanohalarchaeum thermophilum TaxID=1903181 RepID=A0A1Q6DTJ4_METT1|nr:MAG: Sugar kinase ribokinase family [Candidatus Methanohalarchaeum thermophilum]